MESLTGKVAIVTGSTNGIGEVTAKALASQGARVVLISRNMAKLAATADAIEQATASADVHYIQADLSDMVQVKGAADEFKQRYDRLDILVNNAGAIFYERRLSAQGYEMTFALNHLNYFLLTNELLDLINYTAERFGEARIVNVASDAHNASRNLNLNTVATREDYGRTGFGAYGDSKLANILFTYELARQLEGTGVTVNAVHPGFVSTGFGKGMTGFAGQVIQGLLGVMGRFMAKDEVEGAQTSIYVATSPELKGVTGRYFADEKEAKSNSASHDRTLQTGLWELSERLVADV